MTVLAVAGAVIATGVLTAGTASAGALSGTLYRDPNSQAARWVAANPGDSRAAAIRDRIASQPQAYWLSGFNVATVASEVGSVVSAANAAGQVPVLTAYGIPNRDCGGASAGGATSFPQYQQWITNYAQGLGNRQVIVILETDALALQDCLSAGELQSRNQAITGAIRIVKAANPNAKVYLDGGHSAWQPVSVIGPRLIAAGVQLADGFFTNVANYRPVADEVAFGRNLIADLAARGAPGKRQIVDTSRNGGATGASGDWCGDDDTDRRIGRYPTLNTGDAAVDGFLWIKRPGEADGCLFTPGTFLPALAFSQATGVPNPSTPPPTGSTPPAPSPTGSTPPPPPPTGSTPPPPPVGTACTATYQPGNVWQGGFQGQVTVAAGAAPITAWTVTWTLAGGQTISQVWSGTLTTSGSAVTVRNAAWNGAIAAGVSTTFGFNADGAPSTPALTCTAS